MSSPSDRLRETLGQLTDDDFAAIEARLADPNDPVHSEAVEWLPPPPDPFGGNWEWLFPESETSQITSERPVWPTARPAAPRIVGIPRRQVLTALAWAASILLVFSLDRFVLRPGGEPDLDATGARVTPGGALGGQAWTIEVPSDRRAFVTIAVLGPNNIPEFYPESGKFLQAEPGKPLSYTIQGNAGDSLFVILTETPARDLLHEKTDFVVKTRQQIWRDADSFRTYVEETLRSLGFRHFAVRRIILTR